MVQLKVVGGSYDEPPAFEPPRETSPRDSLELILSKLSKVSKHGSYYKALCPAHTDKEESLSVQEKDDGVAVKCFASCTSDAILGALGLDKSILQARSKPTSQELAVYPYKNADGDEVYQVVRMVPKKFVQRRKNKRTGDWIWNIQGVERIPYRLPEMLAAIEKGSLICLTEGEKDVHTLVDEGFTATTTPAGAGNWRSDYARWFSGARVAIIPDMDTAGHGYAAAAAQDISKVAKEIRIVHLSDEMDGTDVTDWFANHEPDELLDLIKRTPLYGVEEVSIDSSNLHATVRWNELGIDIALTGLAFARGEVAGQLSVSMFDQPLIQHVRINLHSMSAKRDLITELNRYTNEMPWHQMLALAFNEGIVKARAGLPVFNAGLHTPPPQPGWLVGDLWPDLMRPCLIFGDGEAGKSTFSLALLMSIAGDCEVIQGEQPSIEGPVMYVDYEDDVDLFALRMRNIAIGQSLSQDRFKVFYEKPTAPFVVAAEALAKKVKDEGVVAVVIDSRTAGMAGAGSLISGEDTQAFMNAIRELGVPAWLIDHLDKESVRAGAPAKHSYGSVATRNAVASSWFIQANESNRHQKIITLHDSKWNHGPKRDTRTYVIDWSNGVQISRRSHVWTPPTQEHVLQVQDQIWDLLDGRSLSIKEIALALGEAPEKISFVLKHFSVGGGGEELFDNVSGTDIWHQND